jgi:hypothetical protein
VALFAGFYFRRIPLALVAAWGALAASNLLEPRHTGLLVAMAQYVCFALPALAGVLLARAHFRWPVWLAASAAPSLVFFIVTNFAVWITASEAGYSRDLAGLAECYTLAIPFYRNMLAGDLFWSAALFGTWAVATRGTMVVATES